MKIQIALVWIVMPCNVVVGYQPLGVPCCLHLQSEVSWILKWSYIYGRGVRENRITFGPIGKPLPEVLHPEDVAARSSETLVSYHITARCCNPVRLMLGLSTQLPQLVFVSRLHCFRVTNSGVKECYDRRRYRLNVLTSSGRTDNRSYTRHRSPLTRLWRLGECVSGALS
jgi:hypothetical protein